MEPKLTAAQQRTLDVLKAGSQQPSVYISGDRLWSDDGRPVSLNNVLIRAIKPFLKMVLLTGSSRRHPERVWVHKDCPLPDQNIIDEERRAKAAAAEAKRLKNPKYALIQRLQRIDLGILPLDNLKMSDLEALDAIIRRAGDNAKRK